MNFKIKKALVLIFIVISLLLVVNSVNATDTYENNTIVDDSLSLANDASIENLNNEISDDVITINSDDGTETEVTNSVAEVSNSNGKLGSTDDSDVLSDHIQNGRFYINVVSDTPVVKPGDEVIFDVYVKNTGPEYGGVFDYEAWNNVLTINNWFDKNQFDLLWVEPTDNWDSNYFKINELKIVEAYGSSYVPIRYKVWGWKNAKGTIRTTYDSATNGSNIPIDIPNMPVSGETCDGKLTGYGKATDATEDAVWAYLDKKFGEDFCGVGHLNVVDGSVH